MLQAALAYHNSGYIIIPIREKTEGDQEVKKPYVYFDDFKSGKDKPTERDIRTWWSRWPKAMIGIITGSINKISVLDFDIYNAKNGDLDELIELFPDFPNINTPTAITPNGGYHFYFQYNPKIQHKPRIVSIVDGRNDGGYIIAPPSISEIGEYKWHNNKRPSTIPFSAIPEQWLKTLHSNININSLYRKNVSLNSQELTNLTNTNNYYIEGRRDDDFFHAANCLIKGKAEPDFAYKTLELIAKNLGPEFQKPKYLEDKINSVLKRVGRQDINIMDEVREWIELTNGNFDLTQCSHELTLTNKNQKQALYMAVKRLCDQGLIEKYGEKRGVYRRIEKIEYEDWMNADYSPIKIDLPFHMQDYVDIFPGDMIVLAGVKNAGKTALALNFIELNLDKYDCYYHSSELVKQTFKLRVSKSKGRTLQEWSKVKMTSGLMMTNAKDKVVKDALNVFDYIEGDEGEFFKIPAAMARIHRALGEGIAVVCLQKPKERDFARGGEGTKDKAALYLTIDKEYPFHVCRITECKAFKEGGENPTGFIQRYKVAGGINLYPEGGLFPEEESKYRGFKK